MSEDILLLWNRAPKTELRVSGLLNNQCRCTFVVVCGQNIAIFWPEKWHRHLFTDSLTALIPLTPFSVAYFMGARYPVLQVWYRIASSHQWEWLRWIQELLVGGPLKKLEKITSAGKKLMLLLMFSSWLLYHRYKLLYIGYIMLYRPRKAWKYNC